MTRLLRLLVAAAAVAALPACAIAQAPAGAPAAEASAAPAGWPPNLRWDLVPKWVQWANAKATVSWPPNDGCAEAPVDATLKPGELIDRFGSEGGTFFSPKGDSFDSRAVPYVCRAMDYRVYKVLKPIPVKTCKAAPWFGEPGGAVQFQTPDPAYKLVAGGSIEAVTYDAGGSAGPAPQCERP